jgi:hypothetical protein
MDNSVVALIGGLVGIGLGWWLATLRRNGRVEKVPIRLKKRSDGTCGVEKVRDVEIKASFGPMLWVIENPEDAGCGTVTVKIGNWRTGGNPSAPPVIAGGALERTVQPGQHKTIPAAGSPEMKEGEYHYDVLIGTEVALDPIVKLIP